MDGRLTNAELAQRVGLSAAPCWRRVRAGESGYITGYHATLDRHKLGLGVLAFVRVDAAQNTADITLRMEEAIRLLPEVTSCHYISGAGTFELQVVARDLESFSGLCAMCCCACPTSKTCTRFFAGRSEVQQRAAAAQHADACLTRPHTVKRVPLAWAIPAVSILKSLLKRCKLTYQ
jgi:DNA-binding Lrp family transcriptional regulator